jgi:hypothetical protein
MFFCTFTYMYIWVYTGEVGAKRLREHYLQAVLRQDIAFFDKVGAGEVATRIQTDTREFGCDVYDLLDCIYICRSRPARHLRESCYGDKSSFSIRNRCAYVF